MASKWWEYLDAGACIPNSNGLVKRARNDFGSIGENATEQIGSSRPPRNGSISVPVFASQTRTVPSQHPEIILDPSGENATEEIETPWPRRGGSISEPVLASQTRMSPSSDPEMILAPSGENATEEIERL